MAAPLRLRWPTRETIIDAIRDETPWSVIEARDGLDALAKASQHEIHVILLDHRMPGLTGAEVARRLRAGGTDVPIILMTAARDVQRLAREVGTDCFLGKPFGFDQLLEQLRRARTRAC